MRGRTAARRRRSAQPAAGPWQGWTKTPRTRGQLEPRVGWLGGVGGGREGLGMLLAQGWQCRSGGAPANAPTSSQQRAPSPCCPDQSHCWLSAASHPPNPSRRRAPPPGGSQARPQARPPRARSRQGGRRQDCSSRGGQARSQRRHRGWRWQRRRGPEEAGAPAGVQGGPRLARADGCRAPQDQAVRSQRPVVQGPCLLRTNLCGERCMNVLRGPGSVHERASGQSHGPAGRWRGIRGHGVVPAGHRWPAAFGPASSDCVVHHPCLPLQAHRKP